MLIEARLTPARKSRATRCGLYGRAPAKRLNRDARAGFARASAASKLAGDSFRGGVSRVILQYFTVCDRAPRQREDEGPMTDQESSRTIIAGPHSRSKGICPRYRL